MLLNKFSQINPTLEIRKLFQLESISFHYATLGNKYINSVSKPETNQFNYQNVINELVIKIAMMKL